MLHEDAAARAVPVDKKLWIRTFPRLRPFIQRIGDVARYDRFEYIRLKRWSAGRVAVLGDAAHAIPPNIGQGAGCAMMNALALAVHLEKNNLDVGLRQWEEKERPLTNHTQRISLFLGMPTFWPPKMRSLSTRSRDAGSG
jgi:2-polyprenyl-6-methoxyphenol hydroxylase-like FAD-dependent oxidoreductase